MKASRTLMIIFLGLTAAIAAGCGAEETETKRDVLPPSDSAVRVYFCTKDACPEEGEATSAQIEAARQIAVESPLVRDVVFVSKEEAFERMRREHPQEAELLPENPLPDSLRITPKQHADAEAIVRLFDADRAQGISSVRSGL